MADAESDFPALRHALQRAMAATATSHASDDRSSADSELAWDRVHRAWDHVYRAYGAMLGHITDTAWRLVSPMTDVRARTYPRSTAGQLLVSEFQLLWPTLVFCRHGAPAPISASSTAFIAQPDNLFDDVGTPHPWAIEQATALASEYGYTVWARRGLAQRGDGDGALLLASGQLPADQAPAFGFTSLTQAD